MKSSGRISVLGAGAWGSALACIAARAQYETILWGRDKIRIEEINARHTNQAYLGNIPLEAGLTATTDLSVAVDGADMLLLSVPTQQLSSLLQQLPALSPQTILITTCKGISRSDMRLPSQTVHQAFSENAVAVLSGPSFADDVIMGLPTAVTIAAEQLEVADRAAGMLSNNSFRCYSTNDVRGVELGGALKNILALAVGATRGMQLGASAEAALIARGFAEISRLAIRLGARQETLQGLSGIGDIVLTCSSPQSRNFAFGMALGKGADTQGMKLAEGAFSAEVALRLAKENDVEVPITEAIVNVLQKRITVHEAVGELLTRPLKREN